MVSTKPTFHASQIYKLVKCTHKITCYTCNNNSRLLKYISRVTAVDGHYQIGIYTVRPIAEGEEITFDYNSVTEVIAISSFCISSNVNCFIL